MPYRITQCYLPHGRGTFPSLPQPLMAGTRCRVGPQICIHKDLNFLKSNFGIFSLRRSIKFYANPPPATEDISGRAAQLKMLSSVIAAEYGPRGGWIC